RRRTGNDLPGSLQCCTSHSCEIYKRSISMRHIRNHVVHNLSVKPELRFLKLFFKAIQAYICLYITAHDRESREMKCSTCHIMHHQSQSEESEYTGRPH